MKIKVNTTIDESCIKKAEQVLIDNGIDEDEVDIVLQAIGYALLDAELYPDDEDDRSEMPWDYGKHFD